MDGQSDNEAGPGHNHWFNQHLGVVLFWASFIMSTLTGVAMYVGMSIEPSGIGDMRRFIQLVLVICAGATGFGISAIVALVASYYERAARTLLVFELALLALCLLPIVVMLASG